jgi:hypothetical protein
MKHANGEWDVSTHEDNGDIVIRSTNGIIANCSIDAWPEMSRNEKEANAKLIAMAPKMLAQLKYLVEVLRITGCTEDDDAIIDTNELIKKAIE